MIPPVPSKVSPSNVGHNVDDPHCETVFFLQSAASHAHEHVKSDDDNDEDDVIVYEPQNRIVLLARRN